MEIAIAAGVNESLIGRYFGGKEGLLVAVLTDSKWKDELIPSITMKSCMNGITGTFGVVLEDFYKKGSEAIREKESFLRIATSRALLDANVAESMRKNILDRKLPELEQGLKAATQKSKLSSDELHAISMLVGSNNFGLNFLGRIVYKMSPKKVDLALSILSEALELYVKSKE